MGLLQQACKTYDCHKDLVGIYRQSDKAVLAPIAHITSKLNIEITIDYEGEFISARSVDKDGPKVIIPATIESMGRTSAPCAHPLCDNIVYIADYNSKKRKLYEEELRKWKDSDYSNPFVEAVYKYVIKNRIVNDLVEKGLIELNENGVPKDDKTMIGWRVVDSNSGTGTCSWKDLHLMNDWKNFLISNLPDDKKLCMISGEHEFVTDNHLKGVVPSFGNAKIISSNGILRFAYLGRFNKDNQALTVGYVHSHKAHNALKWLVENQGLIKGGRVFLCWNPEGRKVPALINPLLPPGEEKIEPSDYKEKLSRVIKGYSMSEFEQNAMVVTATFEAATNGRLSIAYYNEQEISVFLNGLKQWDEYCSFYDTKNGVHAPSLEQIVRCAYGEERDEKGKKKLVVDDRVISSSLQKLILCRVDNLMFPCDIYNMLVKRASNLIRYDDYNRRLILFTACSVIRKYKYDRKKEDTKMKVEPDKKDRSYQYGRLLAILEKAEWDYLKNENSTRETNAMRMQAAFAKRPRNTARILIEQVKSAYYPRIGVSAKIFYEKTIGEIMDKISDFSDTEQNRPLSDSYLIGYYLQKNELYRSNKDDELSES